MTPSPALTLPPMVTICIPPILKQEAEYVAAEEPLVHPAWKKIGQQGRHFVLRTSDLGDVEELADWASSWLEEPLEPLNKAKRQAFQNVINRAGRHVVLKPVGKGRMLAMAWKSNGSDKQR
jgi:hypothetical protein